jgi:hypothetical protein
MPSDKLICSCLVELKKAHLQLQDDAGLSQDLRPLDTFERSLNCGHGGEGASVVIGWRLWPLSSTEMGRLHLLASIWAVHGHPTN